jgi:hypothetical protein
METVRFSCQLKIFARALNPDKRLQIDHIARTKVPIVAADSFGEFEESAIYGPVQNYPLQQLLIRVGARNPHKVTIGQVNTRVWR